MDLWKAFDSVNHDLLLAKLEAYGFSENALKFICSYLKDRRHAVQINNKFSSYKKVQAGVPQGSIDGPLLFNLFINDLVLFLSETFLSSYVDDNNLYSIGKELNIIKEKLRKDFKVVTDWFFENYMTLNPTKWHYMCLGKNKENDTCNFGNISLKNRKEKVILGLAVDNKLSFDNHVKKICRNASQKICALSRISNYLDSKQKEILFKGMIISQFNYCLLIWMFSSRKSNNLINKVHERSLRIVSGDNHSSFKSLLKEFIKEICKC